MLLNLIYRQLAYSQFFWHSYVQSLPECYQLASRFTKNNIFSYVTPICQRNDETNPRNNLLCQGNNIIISLFYDQLKCSIATAHFLVQKQIGRCHGLIEGIRHFVAICSVSKIENQTESRHRMSFVWNKMLFAWLGYCFMD